MLPVFVMKSELLLPALVAFARLAGACGDHGHDKDFTPEELAELERKWGFEVRIPRGSIPAVF